MGVNFNIILHNYNYSYQFNHNINILLQKQQKKAERAEKGWRGRKRLKKAEKAEKAEKGTCSKTIPCKSVWHCHTLLQKEPAQKLDHAKVSGKN